MCMVSYVGDFYSDQFRRYPPLGGFPNQTGPTQAEFDELKRRVDEMIDLMKKAAEIDKKTGQPDCQMDDKLALLRQIAAAVGVDLDKEIKGAAST